MLPATGALVIHHLQKDNTSAIQVPRRSHISAINSKAPRYLLHNMTSYVRTYMNLFFFFLIGGVMAHLTLLVLAIE